MTDRDPSRRPNAEQVATAHYLQNDAAVTGFVDEFKEKIQHSLETLHAGLQAYVA